MVEPAKKILIVTYFWPPRVSGGVWRPLKFAKYLPLFGWEPVVLTTEAPDGEVQSVEETSPTADITRVRPLGDEQLARAISFLAWPLLKARGRSRQWLEEALVWRTRRFCSWPDAGSNNRYILPLVRRALKEMHRHAVDAVYVTSPPHSMVLVAGLLARVSSTPVLLDMRDPWTNSFAYEYGGAGLRLARFAERACWRAIDHVVTVTPAQADEALRMAPELQGKLSCVTNGFDPADIPAPRKGPEDRFVLVLLGGTIDDPQDLLTGIQTAANADADFRSRFQFRWLGMSGDAGSRVRQMDLTHMVAVTGQVPHAQAMAEGAGATALWLESPFGDRSLYVHRGKTFEYLALSKPIIGTAPDPCSCRDLLSGLGRCDLLPTRHPQDIATLLLRSFDAWRRGALVAHYDTQRVRAFGRDRLAGQLAQTLEAMLESGRRRPRPRFEAPQAAGQEQCPKSYT